MLDYEISEEGGRDIPMTPADAERFCNRWELFHQFPRRVIDQQEKIEDQKFRYLSISEMAERDSKDPCQTCVCVRFMEPGYCNRPCRAKIRHDAYMKWREVSDG